MHVRQAKIIFSLVVIMASVTILFLTYFQRTPRIDPRPHRAIGEALAEQAAKQLGTGGRIILIAPDTKAFNYPGAEVQLKAFHQALRRAQLSVAVTNRIRLDPLRLVRVRAEDFSEILRKQSDVDVVISLMGPPILTSEQKTRLGEKHPRVVAVCSGDMPRQVNLKALFAENLLQAAIVSRPRPGASPTSDDPQEWFNAWFQWITPQNVTDLPSVEMAER